MTGRGPLEGAAARARLPPAALHTIFSTQLLCQAAAGSCLATVCIFTHA